MGYKLREIEAELAFSQEHTGGWRGTVTAALVARGVAGPGVDSVGDAPGQSQADGANGCSRGAHICSGLSPLSCGLRPPVPFFLHQIS